MNALLYSLLPALRVLVLAGEVAELADVQTKRFVGPSRQANGLNGLYDHLDRQTINGL